MNYARIPDMLPDLSATGITGEDTRVSGAIAEASKAFRTATGGRQIHSTLETRYFDGDGSSRLWVGDLLSITTLKFDDDGDRVYDETLATTDYWLWPDNPESGYGYRRIDLDPYGDYSAFPVGRRTVELTGKWGMTELQVAVVGAAAITGTVATTSGLTITASADVEASDLVAVGDTFFLGTEELGPVLSVATTDIVVQARGINGTTAATHSTVAMYLRRYPADIERAVRADAARYLYRASQGYPEGGFREMWPAIAMCASSYLDAAAVV